jgi:asparagine synthetase B (glutamine-hydrolysing)
MDMGAEKGRQPMSGNNLEIILCINGEELV